MCRTPTQYPSTGKRGAVPHLQVVAVPCHLLRQPGLRGKLQAREVRAPAPRHAREEPCAVEAPSVPRYECVRGRVPGLMKNVCTLRVNPQVQKHPWRQRLQLHPGAYVFCFWAIHRYDPTNFVAHCDSNPDSCCRWENTENFWFSGLAGLHRAASPPELFATRGRAPRASSPPHTCVDDVGVKHVLILVQIKGPKLGLHEAILV